MNAYIWLAVFVLLLVIEGFNPGLVCLWFAFGALIAFICSLLGASLVVQLIAFAVSSALFVVFLRPFAVRFVNQKRVATNADAVIGKEGLVTEDINDTLGTGQVKITGQVWSARTADGSELPAGSQISVLRIEGAKVIVKKIGKD